MEIYSHNYSVILDDMDLNGYRLKPISSIMYLQDAFARMCATKHLAAYDLFPKNLYWVIAELNMEFTAQLPFWSQEVKVEIWISELTALKIYTDFRLYLGNTLLAKGNGLWFILDQITHRLVKTDIVAASFETHKELVLGEHKRFSMEKPLDTFSSIEHTMNLSDIDFNGHVNNKSLKEANKNFGKKIAKVADIVVIVNKVNFADIKQGLDEENFNSENIYQAETLEKAKLLMKDFIKKGDAILFENDLPDTYI